MIKQCKLPKSLLVKLWIANNLNIIIYRIINEDIIKIK